MSKHSPLNFLVDYSYCSGLAPLVSAEDPLLDHLMEFSLLDPLWNLFLVAATCPRDVESWLKLTILPPVSLL
jgi:hypothetical protein